MFDDQAKNQLRAEMAELARGEATLGDSPAELAAFHRRKARFWLRMAESENPEERIFARSEAHRCERIASTAERGIPREALYWQSAILPALSDD